jgi:uncharacterized protein (TIGR00288 family)
MQNFVNAPHRGDSLGVPSGSPNAALLIDFDNVTMGIRSDLTRQLKELLNSDIIRGKVAVQRAYADWRRYAQYIVPLSEASVDLIFAPAYGSSKKNATDIRLAIDALELVFTRPEIGVYILLSGDSDFSSLVLKLKEYGKYVIGVGLRESASDLLVQNCDEYFSYSTLTGLTKAGEADTISAVDPFDLVERSVTRMAEENDVMRSDRLKQVMLDLDPSFDEGEIGYSKFNKFLTEAASRNKLALRKLGNGQYEVQPIAAGTEAPARKSEPEKRRRRDEPRSRSRPEPREREREPRREQPKPVKKPRPEPQTRERRAEDLDQGYELLKRAVRELIDGPGGAARDSDIKRKMLELESGWDESELGFTKFSRFLRQAHDAEVIDLQRTAEGYYEVRLPSGVGSSGPKREHRARKQRESREESARERGGESTQATAPAEKRPAPPAERSAPSGESDREGSKPEPEAKEAPKPEPKKEAAKPEPKKAAPKPERKKEEPRAEAAPSQAEKEEPKAEAAPTAAEPETEKEATPGRRAPSYGRRDRRGRKAEGPPPLLPGQTVGGSTGNGQPSGDGSAEEASEPAGADREAAEASAGGAPRDEPEETAAAAAEPSKPEPEAEEAAPVEVPGAPEFDAEELGLPTEEGAVIRYLSNSYQGVGQKTAEALIETFGADRVFNGLNQEPEKVREVLGSGRRTDILLEAWQRDYRRRSTAGAGDKQPTS